MNDTDLEWYKAQSIAAMITGVVSIVLAVIAYFTGRSTQQNAFKKQLEFEALKNKFTHDLEKIKQEWTDMKSEKDARRVYEFEARKRLYQEYEPLLFQLMEASDNALHRIQSLARTARNGDLGTDGWLAGNGYYKRSTLYKLFVPLAIYQIMQRKLTQVDLSVDKSVGLHYKLAKQVYLTYTDDYEFARETPALAYNPNDKDWKSLRPNNPQVYWRQGIPMGILDKAIEFLIDKKDGERVITYGEFERKLLQDNSDMTSVYDIFYLFDPAGRPVLWRILIAQALIFQTFLHLQKMDVNMINEELVEKLLFNLPSDFVNTFNWETVTTNEMIIPFDVAKAYLGRRFSLR